MLNIMGAEKHTDEFDKEYFERINNTNRMEEQRKNRNEQVSDTLKNKGIIRPRISGGLLKALDQLKYDDSLFWPLPNPKNKIDTVDDILKYGENKDKGEFFFESPYFYMDKDALDISSLAIGDMKNGYHNDSDTKICHGDYISSFLGNNLVIHSMFGLNNGKELGVINAQKSQKHIAPVFVGEAIKYQISIIEAKKIKKDELGHERVFVKLNFIVKKMNPTTGKEEICIKDGECNVIFFE